MQEWLTFDDVQILPRYSEVESRGKVNTETLLTRHHRLMVPLVAAPMDTVCGEVMALAMAKFGAVGAPHRFLSIDEQVQMIHNVHEVSSFQKYFIPTIATIGAVGDYQERADKSLEAGADILLIDVAHGDHIHVKRALEWLNNRGDRCHFDVIAGNVATVDGALRLEDWGADAVRVGIGGGSMCETRVRTGIGVPQLQAIINITDSCISIPIISDGGIRYPGDVAKALAAGADTVMIGSLFAGTDEAPGEMFVAGQWPNTRVMKMFRGSASATAKLAVNGNTKNVEGASRMIESKGSVYTILCDIMDGVSSSMSYVGANTLSEFRANAEFVRITNSGLVEAHPHGLR